MLGGDESLSDVYLCLSLWFVESLNTIIAVLTKTRATLIVWRGMSIYASVYFCIKVYAWYSLLTNMGYSGIIINWHPCLLGRGGSLSTVNLCLYLWLVETLNKILAVLTKTKATLIVWRGMSIYASVCFCIKVYARYSLLTNIGHSRVNISSLLLLLGGLTVYVTNWLNKNNSYVDSLERGEKLCISLIWY